MRVDVDESRRHHLPARIDHASRRTRRARFHSNDAAIEHGHIRLAARPADAIDDVATADQQVVHSSLPGSATFSRSDAHDPAMPCLHHSITTPSASERPAG
jgi:hypothetical protein